MRSLQPLLVLAGLALTGSSFAQTPISLEPERVPTALRHAGIYHVATGTWTRTRGETANLGPDVVYSNTASSGYFSSAGGAGSFAPFSENIDEGAIPGPTNPGPFVGTPNRNEYQVNCVTIGYCDLGAAGTGGFLIKFYNEYRPCTADMTPDHGFLATGLPANGGCWIVDLDLSGGGEVCITADGDGVWDDDPNLDSFGWSFTYAGSDGAAGNNVGFILAGVPRRTDPGYISGALPRAGSNCYYGTTLCPGQGTGYLTQHMWWLEDPSGAHSGCYFFQGPFQNHSGCHMAVEPLASYYVELGADSGPCDDPGRFGVVYCHSTDNSTGFGAGIRLNGSRVAADDDVTITAYDLPSFSFGLFCVSETQAFQANPGGSQGHICVGGSVGRFIAPGQIKNSGAAGEIELATPANEWSLTAVPTPTGSRASIAGTTDNFQLWHRDFVGGAATSNFSSAISHTWE